MSRLVLTNGRVNAGVDPQTVVIEDGRITQVIPGTPESTPADTTIDLKGDLVLPGFVDGHAHIDKSLWGEPWVSRTSTEASMEQFFQTTLYDWEHTTTPVGPRASAFLAECVKGGSTTVRTFVDVAPEIGLRGLHDVLEIRDAWRDRVDLKVAASAQLGLLHRPGTAQLLEESLRAGADTIASLDPAAHDGDVEQHLDVMFGLAEKYGARVDFHLHEMGELGFWVMSRIAARTTALGMRGRVTLCDVFSLTDPPDGQLEPMADVLAEAEIAVGMGLHGLYPIPDIGTLHAHGVRMFLGSDAPRSRWSPWGDGDILMRAMILAYKCFYQRDEDLERSLTLATDGGRASLGTEPCSVSVGDPADLVVVPGENRAEIVVKPRPRTLVIKAGVIVARNGELTDAA